MVRPADTADLARLVEDALLIDTPGIRLRYLNDARDTLNNEMILRQALHVQDDPAVAEILRLIERVESLLENLSDGES